MTGFLIHSKQDIMDSANGVKEKFMHREKIYATDARRKVMATKNSCTRYIHALAPIIFPESEGVQCRYCPCLETYARKQCRLTGEYLADGYLFGGMCPLIIKEEDNGTEYAPL